VCQEHFKNTADGLFRPRMSRAERLKPKMKGALIIQTNEVL
jgi:hypothetical protein